MHETSQLHIREVNLIRMETGRAGVSPQPPQGWRMEVKVRHSAASSSSRSRAAQAHSQRPANKQGRLPHPFPSQPCACPLSRPPALSPALCSPVACKTWEVGGGDAWGRTVLGCQRRKPCAPLSWSPRLMGTSGFRLPEVSAPDFAAESSACDGETVPKTCRVLLTNPILLQSPSPPRSEHSCPVGPLRPDPPLPPL